jgi:hypothetical protein
MTVQGSIDQTCSDILTGAAHGFLGRGGGVSQGLYAGLNVGLGSGDDREAILENRRRAAEAVLPGAELITVHQVHSADVITVTRPIAIDARPHADSMVTNTPGLLLGILTADCVPVLLFDPAAQVIGAAHAGWKGAIGGIIENTVAAMEKLGADRRNIGAAVGPCIAQISYEVDTGFRDRFVMQDTENQQYFVDGKPDHFYFAIESYVADRLHKAGVGRVDCLALDTYVLEDRFFSYRRSCHRGEPGYGRQISLIGLAEA